MEQLISPNSLSKNHGEYSQPLPNDQYQMEYKNRGGKYDNPVESQKSMTELSLRVFTGSVF